MAWRIIATLMFAILVMAINLHWKMQRFKHERQMIKERFKVESEYLAMKEATKLSYGEKQRLNFALGKHWKR